MASLKSIVHLFDELDNRTRDSMGRKSLHQGITPHIQPRFDVCEYSDAYRLYGELPGMNKEDLHIEFTDTQVLLVSGSIGRPYSTDAASTEEKKEPTNTDADKATKQQEEQSDKPKYWVAERSVGDFSRTFNFAHMVNQDGVTAELSNGVVSIYVPKEKKGKGRHIDIS